MTGVSEVVFCGITPAPPMLPSTADLGYGFRVRVLGLKFRVLGLGYGKL